MDELKTRKSKLKSEKEKTLEYIRLLQVGQHYLIDKCEIERVDTLKEFKQLIDNPNLT